MLLHSLNSHISSLVSDIELFDYAESNPEVNMRWAPIACRDAAMNIWHFQDALDHILSALKRCPPLKTKERERGLRSVIGRAKAQFPEKMRHVAAHPSSHIGTPQARAQNSIRGVQVQNSWAGRKVMNTVEGREISFEMSEVTVNSLRVMRNAVFTIFKTADGDSPAQESG
jgi:hypothetical protein